MPATASPRPVDGRFNSVYPQKVIRTRLRYTQARRSLLMTRQIHRIAALATAGLAVAGLAACSSNKNTTAGTGLTPKTGGTLRIVAGGGPTYLDPVPAYYTANYILERTFARQLLSYPAAPDTTIGGARAGKDTSPVPGVAAEDPNTANAGVSAARVTDTVHIPPPDLRGETP